MFQPADATLYFSLLRHLQTTRLLEVGSGYSSALALDARDRHLPDLKTTFIEPYPDRLQRLLHDDEPEERRGHRRTGAGRSTGNIRPT